MKDQLRMYSIACAFYSPLFILAYIENESPTDSEDEALNQLKDAVLHAMTFNSQPFFINDGP